MVDIFIMAVLLMSCPDITREGFIVGRGQDSSNVGGSRDLAIQQQQNISLVLEKKEIFLRRKRVTSLELEHSSF